MKRKNWIRFLAGACTAALILSGCSKTNPDSGDTGIQSGEGKLFTEPTDIKITVASHASWPYNENWVMWRYFQEATGAAFEIQTIPAADMKTKVALMMASPDNLPDLLHLWEKALVDQHASAGAFISLSDNQERLPNYTAFWETVPEEERKDIFAQRTSGDGKIYSAPAYGTQTVNNLRTWMYREDIFRKHQLAVPQTFEELYQTAKKLKELYPESYPLCFRTGFMKFDEFGPSWQNDFSLGAYYDYEKGVWRYGAREPVMKEMVEYFLKLKNEDLVPPDYLTMPTKSWEELMSTDRGFITLDYVVRIDFFNIPGRQENPDYTLKLMKPPASGKTGAEARLMKSNLDYSGYCICNTGKSQRENNAFKLLDWMYTDEGSELLSWGKENETYQVADGKKSFILADGEVVQNTYGVGTYGLYQRMDTAANEAIYTDEQVAACHELLNYLEPRSNPASWVPLEEEEEKRIQNLKAEITAYMEESVSKFLLGQRPMSEWDDFQKGLEQMGVDELLEIYSAAYARIQ